MSNMYPPFSSYICTASQSQQIDEEAVKSFGIESFTLMEIAGYSASQQLLMKTAPGSHVIYLCGKGNNAGDALVIARYLLQHNVGASLVFLNGIENLSPDTQKNLGLLKKIANKDRHAASLSVFMSWTDFATQAEDKGTFIIDGMLGTGLNSELRGDYVNAVKWANQSGLPVYAIDIPTGLHADSGNVLGTAIHACETFTFGTLKQGFYLNKGPLLTGLVTCCELPFPNYLKEDCSTFLLNSDWIKPEPRKLAPHKYEAGVLYVIAGSEGLTGAAMMATQSAWSAGLGVVILITPYGNLSVFENNLPQIIKKPIGKRDDYFFKKEHLSQVQEIISEKEGVVLLGPGLGRDLSTVQFVHHFLDTYTGRVLIDADGLWCMAQQSWNKPSSADWILTPHPGELQTLCSHLSIQEDESRLNQVREFARNNELTLLSKGFPVIIGTKNNKIYLTGYDTRKFARAGFGDVLAGKVGAYWTLQNSPEKSCALALFDGKQKLDMLFENRPDDIAEPKDLI